MFGQLSMLGTFEVVILAVVVCTVLLIRYQQMRCGETPESANRKGCAVVVLGVGAFFAVIALVDLDREGSADLLGMLTLVGLFVALGCSLWLHEPSKKKLQQVGSESRPASAPPWFLPAGMIALLSALLGFLASALVGGGGTAAGSILAGLLNPLFFVGLPLGIYWLYRFGQNRPRIAPPRDFENNPKLTHCADCGHHVSRMANVCPNCGRPLTPENPTQQ